MSKILRTFRHGKFAIHLEYKLADCWIGAFWQRQGQETHIWVCIVPCLPFHIIIPPTPGRTLQP